MDRAAGSGIEVELPQDPEVRDPPDKSKYFFSAGGAKQNPSNQSHNYAMGDYYGEVEGSNYPVNAQHPQPEAKKKNRPRAIWVLAVAAIISLSVALGAGLGAGLAAQHKSDPSALPSSPASTISTSASNAPVTVTRSGSIATITPTPTALPSASCPATNGSTYVASNKPSPTDKSQIPQTTLPFEILCNTNSGEDGLIVDMQLISNVSTLNDCMDACALFNFQMRLEHFPASACTGVSWGHGINLIPNHVCWLKGNVTLESSNDTLTWPGYDAAVLLLDT